MATEASGASGFEARVLDSISALPSSFDTKLADFKRAANGRAENGE